MSTHAFFKVTAKVAIDGNPPGHIVHIEVDEYGAPIKTYWRKRLADGDIAPHAIDRSPASESKSPSPKPKKGA